jgi:hypothetical protein
LPVHKPVKLVLVYILEAAKLLNFAILDVLMRASLEHENIIDQFNCVWKLRRTCTRIYCKKRGEERLTSYSRIIGHERRSG